MDIEARSNACLHLVLFQYLFRAVEIRFRRHFNVSLIAIDDELFLTTVAITGCRDQLPDPAFYAECLDASFAELRSAAVE